MEYVAEAKPAIIDQDGRGIAKIAIIGAVLGVVAWGLALLLEKFILRAMFCGNESASACVNVDAYAGNIAAVVVAIIGVVALVRAGVFRPLLIVLGSTISLWGLAAWLSPLTFVEQALWSALLFALAYVLYAWIARIRHAVVVLILFVVVALATRLIPLVV